MNLSYEDKKYLLDSKIKALRGKSQRILEGNPIDQDTEEDIQNKIQALTNMLEML
jgi:hypothetical protein